MSILDFFSDVVEEIKDFINDGREILPSIEEDIEELGEIMTDGAFEIIVKDNDNYKTSREKKEEARSRISSADADYAQKFQVVSGKYDKLLKHEEEITRKRKTVYEEYAKSIGKVKLPGQICAPIQTARPVTPTSQYAVYPPSADVTQTVIIAFCEQIHRVNQANQYLEDAKDYEVKVAAQKANLSILEANIDAIEASNIVENQLLDTLATLKGKMSNQDCNKAIEQLYQMMTNSFFSTTCERTQNYKAAINNLKALVRQYI